jgi:hypothetical protein
MARRRIDPATGMAAVREGYDPPTAVRSLLQGLADAAPGNTLEVRVPPYGAAQVVEGPRHTRGTPPNVIEMDAATWVALATGALGWDDAVADALVTASGQRADLREWLPVPWES